MHNFFKKKLTRELCSLLLLTFQHKFQPLSPQLSPALDLAWSLFYRTLAEWAGLSLCLDFCCLMLGFHTHISHHLITYNSRSGTHGMAERHDIEKCKNLLFTDQIMSSFRPGRTIFAWRWEKLWNYAALDLLSCTVLDMPLVQCFLNHGNFKKLPEFPS